MSEYNRLKDHEWTFCPNASGNYDADTVQTALLMDIRDELKKINRVLNCSNCLDIPFKLDKIVKNTTKPRRKKRAA